MASPIASSAIPHDTMNFLAFPNRSNLAPIESERSVTELLVQEQLRFIT